MKLVGRHRGVCAAAGIVGLTLVLTSAVSLYFADQSRKNEKIATARQKELEAKQQEVQRITKQLGEIIANESVSESLTRLELRFERAKPDFESPRIESVVISGTDASSKNRENRILSRRDLLLSGRATGPRFPLPDKFSFGSGTSPFTSPRQDARNPKNSYSASPPQPVNPNPQLDSESALESLVETESSRVDQLQSLLKRLEQASAALPPNMMGD